MKTVLKSGIAALFAAVVAVLILILSSSRTSTRMEWVSSTACHDRLSEMIKTYEPWWEPGRYPAECEGLTRDEFLAETMKVARESVRRSEIGEPTSRPSDWRKRPEYRN